MNKSPIAIPQGRAATAKPLPAPGNLPLGPTAVLVRTFGPWRIASLVSAPMPSQIP